MFMLSFLDPKYINPYYTLKKEWSPVTKIWSIFDQVPG